MKMIKILGLVSLLFVSTAQANMVCVSRYCEGIPWRLLVYPDGRINIWPMKNNVAVGGENGPLQCLGVDNNRAVTIPDGEGKDRAYSLVLAAIASERSVFIRMPDNNGTCNVSYVRYSDN